MEKFEVIKLENREFIKFVDGKVNILFSTAENNISYKINTEEGTKNLSKLKDLFSVDEVKYTNQIHSSIVFETQDGKDLLKENGDAIISNKNNEIVGVFTADCVPVILYDTDKNIIAAIHSGWKGTIGDISRKTAEIMKNKYGAMNIKALIGPHIGSCCYEVSEELALKFSEKYGNEVRDDRMLNLEYAIRKQLEGIVENKNIKSLNICTNCNKKYKMHSYRRDSENAGRLFSFAYIKED